MIERMREIAAAEKIAIEPEALSAIAYRADGGLRDALTMLEQATAFARGGSIGVETLDVAFGTTGREFANALVDAILARDAAGLLSTIETASDAGTDMQVLIRSLIAAFRNLLVARIDADLLARDLAPEDARHARERAKDVSQTAIVRALRLLVDAQALARSGGHARLELESALLRFVLAREDAGLDALAARVAELEASGPRMAADAGPKAPEATPRHLADPPPVSPSVIAEPAPEPAASPGGRGSGTLTLQKVRAAWQSIRGKVEGERSPLAASLSRAAVHALDDRSLVLRFPDKLNADLLRDHVALVRAGDRRRIGRTVVRRLPGGSGPLRKRSSAVRAPRARYGRAARIGIACLAG